MARLKQAEAPQVKAHGLAEIGRKIGLGAALTITPAWWDWQGRRRLRRPSLRTATISADQPMTLADAVRASLPARDQTPVRVSSTQDVVNQFQAGRQIYVVGISSSRARA